MWRDHLLTGAPLARCPLRDLLEARRTDPAATSAVARHADDYYPAYVDGHLLETGGWTDQPARYADFMLELRALEGQIDLKYLTITKEQEST